MPLVSEFDMLSYAPAYSKLCTNLLPNTPKNPATTPKSQNYSSTKQVVLPAFSPKKPRNHAPTCYRALREQGHLTARSDVYGFGVVLLEMLIGRRAMDKSRPSREHNLVEWARPLLIHNKKLLRILDPRVEGQYSTRTALKVAHLAYQCLSQNPKGRPVMSQVVEILETLQTQEESQEDALLRSGGGGSITLYEAPKATSERRPVRTESDREVARAPAMSIPANGRSKSEPPKEWDLYRDSPDLGQDEAREFERKI